MILQNLRMMLPGKTKKLLKQLLLPAYLTMHSDCYKDAGKIAGLDVKRIINEPTVAALVIRIQQKKRNRSNGPEEEHSISQF